MADVSKVHGPSGPLDNAGKKDKSSVDADKFKQAMHKRVTEVSQVDPDEQKKRKRREEAEEDTGQVQTGPTTPASQVTPFSLEQGTKRASPLDLQSGGPGRSPMASMQPAPPSPPSGPLYNSAPEEMEDDSAMLEQESFTENIPTKTASLPPSQQPSIPQEQQPLTSSQTPQQQTAQTTEASRDTKKGEHAHKDKAGVTAKSLEGMAPSKVQDTSKFYESMAPGEKHKGKSPLKIPEGMEKEAEMQGVGGTIQPTPFSQTPEGKEVKEDKKKIEAIQKGAEMETTGLSTGMGDTSMMANLPLPSPESLPSYANLPPQVMELFDRMVGVMTVMTMSGVTETSITLNMPQFASSVFFGTQIIIEEFSTAPKAFNVQLNGTPQAVALFQANAGDLMAAFQSGSYNYRINRLETSYLSDRPLFKRKEKIRGKENEKETGENR